MFENQIAQINDLRQRQARVLDQLASEGKFVANFRDVSGNGFRGNGPMAGQLFDLHEALAHGIRALRAFRAIKLEKATPVPESGWAQALGAANELESAAAALSAQLEAIRAETGPMFIRDNAVVVRDDGNQVADLRDAAARTVRSADAIFISLPPLAIAARVDLESEAEELAIIRNDEVAAAEAAQRADAAKNDALRARDAIVEIEGRYVEFETTLAELLQRLEQARDEHLAKLAQAVDSTAEYVTRTSNDAAVATSKKDDVERMEAAVTEAHRNLMGFDETLSATQERLEKAHQQSATTVAAIGDQEQRVASLISEAEKMVSGATVAGLAKAFADERAGLERSMRGAFWGFIAGILLLTAASLLLAAYVLNVSVPGFGWLSARDLAAAGKAVATGMQAKAGEPTLVGVISRAVIIAGPFWLTLFSARRYRSLFDLRQQYSHKYNMAFSMEGFKNQAPQHREAIAAWVFQIVAAAPVMQPVGRTMDTPPPWSVDEMLKEVGKRFETVFGGQKP